jgi:hypothetical protein
VFSKWSFSFRFPQQNPVCNLILSHTCHILRPSRSLWCDHPNSVRRGVQIMNLLITKFSPVFCYLLLDPDMFLTTQFSNTLILYPFLNVGNQAF